MKMAFFSNNKNLIEQGKPILRRHCLKLPRWLGLLFLLTAWEIFAEPVNHYIVLFDASGSMGRDYAASYNFWEGRSKDSDFMAQRISALVNKSLESTPAEFPPITKNDWFSFLLFRINYDQPSYQPQNIFLTNSDILLHRGLPPARAYQSFSSVSKSGQQDERIPVTDVFRGHSPLVAATTAALPFLGQAIPAKNDQISRTFIIRITDGSYNSDANASDEYAKILRNIDDENRKYKTSIPYPNDFSQYREISQRVNNAFEIGAQVADCVLMTHNVRNPLNRPFNCEADAFSLIKKSGTGLMISYREVMPRGPDLKTLAQPEKRTLSLQREVRDGGVEYVDANAIQAFSSRNDYSSIYPVVAQWKLGEEGAWRKCDLMEDGGVHCQGDGNEVRLGKDEYKARLSADGTEMQDRLHYRVQYERVFTGGDPLYPFVYAPVPVEFVVDLRLDPASLPENNKYYPPPASATALLPSWLNPLRIVRFGAPEIESQPVTDELLLSAATLPEYREIALTPQRLTQDSGAARATYLADEGNENFKARVFYSLLALAGILVYLFWPWRKLRSEARPLVDNAVVIDFNKRDYEQIVLIGLARIRNIAKSLNQAPFKLRAVIDAVKFYLGGADSPQPVPLDFVPDGVTVAVGGPGKTAITDERAISDKEYPVYFDPRAIADCRLPAPDKGHELRVEVRVALQGPREEPLFLDYPFELLLRPEHGVAQMSRDPRLKTVDAGKRRIVETEYRAGQEAHEVCVYRFRNTTRHQYSWPARGRLWVTATRADGVPLDDNVVCLVKPHEDPLPDISYSLAHGESFEAPVVVDFNRLPNPIEQDSYRVIVYWRILNQEEEEERNTHSDEWQLIVARSAERTAASMRVIDLEQRESPALNQDRPTVDEPFVIGGGQEPVALRAGGSGVQNNVTLFSVRLTNACRNGFGFARWQCRLNIIEPQPVGLLVAPAALRLVDDRGIERRSGELYDSPDEAKRVVILAAELQGDHPGVAILQRLMTLNLAVQVDWDVFEDGDHNRQNVHRFTTRLELNCTLKHEPPDHVLAIDFGTSALAIAHAVGPQPMLLPLQDRLTEIQAQDRKIYRLDNPNGDSDFLSSECNVNPDTKQLAQLHPYDPEFLILPLLEDAVRTDPATVFLSLKALMSAGFRTLPMPVRKYPYLGDDGNLERSREPALGQVIQGAYQGLLKRFIKPILEQQGKNGFSYVLVTYPNTYTRNHVEQLKENIERVFVNSPDVPPPNVVYPENIDFCSESDAVALYYLVNAWSLNGKDWNRIPACERILVYDIGAGTLDLTHLEVDWESNPAGGKSPKAIRVKHRAGANRAGNLLDECIARDLHEHLQRELDDKRYLNPIVVPGIQGMDAETRFSMDMLRQEIHQLKVKFSETHESIAADEGKLRVLLTPKRITKPLVKTEGADTPKLYQGCVGFVGTPGGDVYWEPEREQIMNGRYVKAFFDQVTRREVYDFFGGKIPALDTVIVSGRTSLWPGFEDHLRETLGNAAHWVSFNRDSNQLKLAVVLGALGRWFYWRNLVVEDAGIVGDYVVLYEHEGPNDWRYHVYEESGRSNEFYLGNAAQVKIGIRTSNGFHQCFGFAPVKFFGQDKKLTIKLVYDRTGYLQAEVKNNRGRVWNFRGLNEVATLSYTDRPWPLGASKLSQLEPQQVIAATSNEPLSRLSIFQ